MIPQLTLKQETSYLTLWTRQRFTALDGFVLLLSLLCGGSGLTYTTLHKYSTLATARSTAANLSSLTHVHKLIFPKPKGVKIWEFFPIFFFETGLATHTPRVLNCYMFTEDETVGQITG